FYTDVFKSGSFHSSPDLRYLAELAAPRAQCYRTSRLHDDLGRACHLIPIDVANQVARKNFVAAAGGQQAIHLLATDDDLVTYAAGQLFGVYVDRVHRFTRRGSTTDIIDDASGLQPDARDQCLCFGSGPRDS